MSETTRLAPPPTLEVKTLSVEVVEGPQAGKSVESEEDTLSVGSAKDNDLVLSDDAVSGYHLELSISEHGIDVVDLASTNGTLLGNVRLRAATIPLGSTLTIGRSKLRISDGAGALVTIHSGPILGIDMVGESAAMRRLMAQASRVASSEVPTLLFGESGTGKEVFARAIHAMSARRDKPFVTVDCGAFSPNLVASELFGHERGAFTGAERQHIGAFERADGGVLFLDEIGELPIELQPQLLGALERRRFRRVGGSDEIEVDVQIVSATNRDLRHEVNQGGFRLDLYYRVAIVVLRLPALREHPDDIPLLVEHFLRELGHEGSVDEVVSDEVMASLSQHRWPGNIRELRNWVEATMALGEAGELNQVASRRPQSEDGVLHLPYKEARAHVLDGFERKYLERLIAECGNNVSAAARNARMDRTYLLKLLQRHGLR